MQAVRASPMGRGLPKLQKAVWELAEHCDAQLQLWWLHPSWVSLGSALSAQV